jgi:hypothetical protein
MIKLIAIALLGAVVVVPTGAVAQSASKIDARAIQACVSAKAGPEGDLPPEGPVRQRIMKEMEGGVQACVGVLQANCQAAGGEADACRTRESRAWLEALRLDAGATRNQKNRAIWTNAATRIRGQAIAMCEGAAAISAWGGARVAQRGRYGMSLADACVRDAIAQQALIMLVNARGN